MSHHVPVDKFHVCPCYFNYHVSVWKHSTYFDISKDICKLKSSNYFACLERSCAQVCYECLYTKLWIRELDMTYVNSVLDKSCFSIHTDSAINKWTNKTENCYRSFQRRKFSLKHEDVYQFFCFGCIKVLVFHIFYFDFFILDKEYKIKNV